MGYRSDSIAISRDMEPLRSEKRSTEFKTQLTKADKERSNALDQCLGSQGLHLATDSEPSLRCMEDGLVMTCLGRHHDSAFESPLV